MQSEIFEWNINYSFDGNHVKYTIIMPLAANIDCHRFYHTVFLDSPNPSKHFRIESSSLDSTISLYTETSMVIRLHLQSKPQMVPTIRPNEPNHVTAFVLNINY